MRVRVVTVKVWNEDGDPRRVDIINHELRRLEPDLVGLQEVVYGPGRDQLERLVAGLGLHSTHQAQVTPATPPGGERYGGNAVATRWPHRFVESLDLRLADAPDVPWYTLAVSVPLPGEGEVLFIVTIASWRLEAESARERQVVALTDLDARHRTDLPTIIAGDLNATPDAASIRYLTGLQSLGGRSVYYHDAWAVAGDGPVYTWTADNPNASSVMDQIVRQPNHRRRIDHIFVGSWQAHPQAHGRIQSAKVAFNRPVDGIWDVRYARICLGPDDVRHTGHDCCIYSTGEPIAMDARAIPSTNSSSFDSASNDEPYQFGRRPTVSAPFPFTERQFARLLIARGRVQATPPVADQPGA
jgi:endonuclease/exonuclease/phosphatase family metal-dependent hydrolase